MKKTWQVVSVIVAIVALGITIWQTLLTRQSTKHELGGTLSASLGDQQVSIGETSDIVVLTTDNAVYLNNIDIAPTFTNVTKYSVHDILAEYIVSGNVTLTSSDYYSSVSQGGKTTLQRNEHLLYAHRQTEQPFVALAFSGSEAHSTIESSVTYDGAMMPFQYTTNLLVMKVAKRSSQSLEQWKQQCRIAAQRRMDGKKVDIYYCASSYVSNEKGVVLGQTVTQPAKTEPTTRKQQNTVTKTKPSTRTASSSQTKQTAIPQTVEVTQSENATVDTEKKCGLLVSSESNPETRLLKATYTPSDRRRNLVLWGKMEWKDSDQDYFYSFTSNAGEKEWSLGNNPLPKLNNKYPKKIKVIDVMEEDSTLLSGIEINGSKVRNRTGRSVLCIIHTVDGYRHWHLLSGKWYGYKKVSFKSEVDKITVYPVKKRNVGGSWLWLLLVPIGFVYPVVCTYCLIKNKFNIVDAIDEGEDEFFDSTFWAWVWMIATIILWLLIFYWFFVNIFIY